MNTHIHEITLQNGTKYFDCVYPRCTHPFGFDTKRKAGAHIHSVHVREKPFVCELWFVTSLQYLLLFPDRRSLPVRSSLHANMTPSAM